MNKIIRYKFNPKLLCFIAIMVVGFFVGALLLEGRIWFVYPDREKYPIMGIDISHHQGDIDWMKVKEDGVGFVFIKATEGDDWIDSQFEVNFEGARSVGIPVGIYHFYSLRIPAKDQLDNITRTLSGKVMDFPIVIDLEFGGNSKFRPTLQTFQSELQVLLDGIEKQQGRKPILYSTYEFHKEYLQNKYSNYPLWIRDVFSYPNLNNWLIWQYKNLGHVSGIKGFVDQNVLSGSIDELLLR